MSTRGLSRGSRERVQFSLSLVTKGLCRDERRLRAPLAFETDMKGTIYFPSASDYVYWFDVYPGVYLWTPVPHMIILNSPVRTTELIKDP